MFMIRTKAMPMKLTLIPGLLALVAALAFGAPDAGAFGGGSSSSQPATSAAGDITAGRAAADAGDHKTAIAFFRKAVKTEPTNADAYNLLGFSYRRLDDLDKALEYYTRALQLNRTHRGANEYIGELYLETGDLARAEHHLSILGTSCAYSCPEYAELKEGVEEYKATHGG